ncbi:hypothetical protein IRJ41_014481 [Triplophysa rosa]|uniref:Uncharacterized protein n=1 Tax=Triplophysa rosa TaxID=992332 RepID=A0A9W7X312_TRIRA|nr:hypothetical protein IRJ41_014481 [Triplophysa rosa]
MTLSFLVLGLLSLWVLIMLLAVPCRPTHCNVTKRILFTKCTMENLRCVYLNTNAENIKCWPHPIPELDLKTPVSTEDKIQKGVCGLRFIQDALGLIYAHQRDIHSINNDIFHKINTMEQELFRSEKCVEGGLKEQCRNETKPDFNHDDMYSRLQWGRTIIESSIGFMEQLEDLVKHGQKLNFTLGSLLKHPPCRCKCIMKHKYDQLCSQDRH